MKILVTGGAGYIGSFTVKQLLDQGVEVVVFDNLVYGHRQALDKRAKLIVGDLLNRGAVKTLFSRDKFNAVVHFAAYAYTGESMSNPYKYFHSNVDGSLNLIDAAAKAGVRKFVFSSSCCLYGQPKRLPVKEDSPFNITNVYGETKYSIERLLFWYDKIFGLKSVSLRYFNACGAALDGSLGEDHRPETHIIPLAIETVLGRRKHFDLNGKDYPTSDGTCVRDYIHVLDLAKAHLKALEYLQLNKVSPAFNVGVGRGYSNWEIVKMVREVSGVAFPVRIGPRRIGDANEIYADNTKAKKELGWQPRYGLREIVESAYLWHKNHPRGYNS